MDGKLSATAIALVLLVVPAAAQAQTTSYTVQKGDTLSEIAQRNGVSLAALEQANPQIRNYDRIYPGDRVQLPPRATSPAVRPAASAPASGAARSSRGTGLIARAIDSFDRVRDQVQGQLRAMPQTAVDLAARAGDMVTNAGVAAIRAIRSGTLRNPNEPDDPTNWSNWCRALIREAFRRATGRSLPELSAGRSAWASYQAFEREGLVQHGPNPPLGAIVFWSPAARAAVNPNSAGARYGHIAISNGDGTCITNSGRTYNPAKRMSEFGQVTGWVVIPACR